LCERDRRTSTSRRCCRPGSWDAVIADASAVRRHPRRREALEILADLPERQRADLTLLVAGFSYVEIAEMTGGRTYTNVNSTSQARAPASRLLTSKLNPRATRLRQREGPRIVVAALMSRDAYLVARARGRPAITSVLILLDTFSPGRTPRPGQLDAASRVVRDA